MKTEIQTPNQVKLNLIEIFHEYLDHLYWTGFAEFLLQNDAKTYQFEYEIFSHIYDYQASESTYSKGL